MDKIGQFWTHLDKYRYIKFGQFWTRLEKFGQVWTCLEKFGTDWDSFGEFWTSLDSFIIRILKATGFVSSGNSTLSQNCTNGQFWTILDSLSRSYLISYIMKY